MERGKVFHSEKSYRGHKITVYALPVSATGCVLDGYRMAFVAEIKDSLHPEADMESRPFDTPAEAINEAIDFVEDLVKWETEDLDDEATS